MPILLKDSMTSLRQRVAEVARELGVELAQGRIEKTSMMVGAMRRSLTPSGAQARGVKTFAAAMSSTDAAMLP